MDTDLTLFEVSKPVDEIRTNDENDDKPLYTEADTDECRFIQYKFSDSFLRIRNIGAT